MIHLYASRSNYHDHLAPIWAALPDEHRGRAYGPKGAPWAHDGQLSVRRTRQERLADEGDVWLVASAADNAPVRPAPVIHVEHGSGQSYGGDESTADAAGYSGGRGMENVRLFIGPNAAVADRWKAAYPDAATATVGCPRLDSWLSGVRGRPLGEVRPATAPAVVAVTFHWSCALVPEAQWALPHFRPVLGELKRTLEAVGVELWGHGHPRAFRQFRDLWQRLGVRVVEDSAEVLDRADVLVADNTSLSFEAAAVGIPCVVMTPPWYRREVSHGLRFWDHLPGREVTDPDLLANAVLHALNDDSAFLEQRRAAASAAYAHLDGKSTERAVDAIMAVL